MRVVNAGGSALRGFNPTELIEYAWSNGLEDTSVDSIYAAFVDHQQVQAQQSLWTQLMDGSSLQHLANMSAVEVEQFSLFSGQLEHEVRKGVWESRFCILWRDPVVPIDKTEELGLLVYETSDSWPIIVLQLTVGEL